MEKLIPIGTKVLFKNQPTVVIGHDPQDQWVFILVRDVSGISVPGFESIRGDTVDGDWEPGVIVDDKYAGGRGYWTSSQNVIPVGSSKPEPKGPDGCNCIRCNGFCEMSANNLMKTSDLNDPEILPSAVKKAFACYSCRDTVAWWIRAQGWTITG